MITKIETADDIKPFAKQLIAEGVSFHPDGGFDDYVNLKENKPCYRKEEADLRNGLMSKYSEVYEKGGIDIYDTMLEVSSIETGMDKFIPLPSQPYPENN